ncbi:glycosyltransferase family 2 protein [Paenibacillus sp. GCM10023248]|uniref:glycosyltransferase family 2 protein n=1 Tax=unclassified Paenibacillus TaxID=185978 RepID=UPI002378AFD0|nr:glycosyltransferase family 2 protein [Paenibacillus sp. MAHUQ-63]MDD9266529.1 glycosyltransferase [Paenibacillus sp. MAHUQ-63]
MSPKVSVIVPVYNCEKYISNCLESIISQTYSNIEIILVNDGSTDGSENLIKKYLDIDKRIFYCYQDNSGPSTARNKGISSASGEYLVFVDSDDTIDKLYIEHMLDNMLVSQADLVCCGYKDISIYGVLNCTDFYFTSSDSKHNFMEMVCEGTGGVLWGKIYKAEIIKKNNLQMDKNIFMSEDLVFVLQYATYCSSFVAIREYLYHYNRLNQNSISSNISVSYLKNYILVCKHMENIFRTVNMTEHRINQIVTKRIQDVVINLVEQQSINLKLIGIKKAINNVKQLVTAQYIEEYKNNFETNSTWYKPYIYLVKNDLVRTSIVYGVLLNALRNFKKKFTRREVQKI